MAWVYSNHRYVNGKRVLTEREMLDLRNAIADGMTEESAGLASKLVSGVMTLVEWAKSFARLIANGVSAAFMLGRGGKAAMDETAMTTLSSLISDQHDYAKAFVTDLATALDAGTATEAGVAARSSLYSGAAVNSFHVGQSQDWMIDLPYYPGDGLTVCGGNCRCEWSITDTDTEVTAIYHTVGDEKTCDDCIARGNEFGPDSPFIQSKAAA
jgi:hypothetical protein